MVGNDRSLEPLILGEESDFESETFAQGISNTALIHGHWKAIYVDSTDTYYLYDLASDPRETRNLWVEAPTFKSDLRERLNRYLSEAAKIKMRAQRDLDSETIKRLKSLGYLQ